MTDVDLQLERLCDSNRRRPIKTDSEYVLLLRLYLLIRVFEIFSLSKTAKRIIGFFSLFIHTYLYGHVGKYTAGAYNLQTNIRLD